MATIPALLAAAAGVGFGHAVLPDHWVPLGVVSRTQRHPVRRTARLATLAGIAHVALSLILGAVVIGVGLQFRSSVERHEDVIVGGVLLATGMVFLVLELLGKGHGHAHDADGNHSHGGHPHGSHGDHEHAAHGGHGHDHSHVGHSHVGHSHGEHSHGGLAVASRPGGTVASGTVPGPRTRSRASRLAAFAVPFGAAASPDLTVLPVFLAASATGPAAALGTLLVFSLVTLVTIVGLTLLAALGGYRLRGAWIDRSANLLTALTLASIGGLVAAGLV